MTWFELIVIVSVDAIMKATHTIAHFKYTATEGSRVKACYYDCCKRRHENNPYNGR